MSLKEMNLKKIIIGGRCPFKLRFNMGKANCAAVWLWICAIGLVFSTAGLAQGTAITYQGNLVSGGAPANGAYDLTFGLYPSNSGVPPAGTVLTNLSVPVSNGLFTVMLDFGSAFNNGGAYWLEIGVRPSGTTNPFTVLSPRQPVTPTPYAITAANLTGALTAGNLAGIDSNALSLTNAGNLFAG